MRRTISGLLLLCLLCLVGVCLAEATETPFVPPTPTIMWKKATPTPTATATPAPREKATSGEDEATATPEAKESAKPEAETTAEATETAEGTVAPEAKETAEAEETPEVTAEPEATEAPTPEVSPKRENAALISFIGDCSIGDAIQSEGKSSSYHGVIAANGYDWPFSLVKEYLASDDLTVANLEVVLTTRTKHKNKVFPLRGKPEFTEVLKEGSIEAVNTINNHCEDFGRDGYKDTLDTLDAAGILRFGCNRAGTENGYDDLLVQDINGIRFGIMGFSYPQNSDIAKIEERCKRLKEEQGCDIVIVSLHWGREGYDTPNNGQIPYAKKVINAGADMVYGHHPHVIQPIHFYQGKPILYSTGNFTFGTMSRMDPATGIFQLTWEKEADGTVDLKKLQVIACETTRSPDFRPTPLTDEEAKKEVYAKLRFRKDYKDCVNLPESFLETGIVEMDHGEFVNAGTPAADEAE